MQDPIISICIPTYSRAKFLVHLLKSLERLKDLCGEAIQICVSNNCSPDDTAQVLERWKVRLGLTIVTQSENIGSTRNCIEVSRLAIAPWLHTIGDDDVIDATAYAKLIERLRDIPKGTWILTGVSGDSGREIYLNDIKAGHYATREFDKVLLRTGSSRYGFIGEHIFPSARLHDFYNLPITAFLPWPHMALFLRHLAAEGEVFVWRQATVSQAGAGAGLFWRADDWARMHIQRIQIILAAKQAASARRGLFTTLAYRELYSLAGIKIPLSWKLREPATFTTFAVRDYRGLVYTPSGTRFGLWPYYLFVRILVATPAFLFHWNPLRGKIRDAIQRYADEKKRLSYCDGVTRKL